MGRFGFCGSTYQSQSLNVDAQRAVNFFPESDESGTGKTAVAMYPLPGSKLFAALSGPSVRGALVITEEGQSTGRMFAVSGAEFYEVFSDGSTTLLNPLTPFGGSGPVSMAASPVQLLICDGAGGAYCFNLSTNLFENLQTYSAGVGGILDPVTIAQAGIGYTAGDVSAPVASGTGAQIEITSVSTAAGGPVTTASLSDGGSDYSVNDVLTIVQAGGSGATVKVLVVRSIPGHGGFPPIVNTATSIQLLAGGTGYATAGSLSTTYGGAGTGLKVNITATGTPGGAATGLAVNAAGTGYVPSTNVPVTGGTGTGLQVNYTTSNTSPGSGMIDNPVQCAYVDGFFIVLQADSRLIQVSQPLDASLWDPTQVAKVSVFSDNVVSMLAAYRQLWLWGERQSQVYYDSGNVFPFDVVPGAFIEQGCAARYCPVRLDNSIFWLGEDERGARMAWRANGYTPVRVSNHAIENAWMGYTTIADAVGYAWQYSGHAFWRIFFPTAKKTWEYDAATGAWHEVTSWNASLNDFSAHRSQCHVFAFGKHLVGDPYSGNIYELAESYYDDDGDVQEHERISPYVFREQQWVTHHQLTLDVEVGLGPQPALTDGSGNPRDPQLILSWSDNQGKTWSNDHVLDCGQSGQYLVRVVARRLGRSRGRIYKVRCTDPIAWRFADAYLVASPGFTAGERMTVTMGKVA